MLRSSGFFRGVECPFGPACGRPYCPFRHAPGHAWPPRRLRPQAAGPSTRGPAECGYDPYNPELPKPSAQSENEPLEDVADTAPSILELELVNKAIEAVKNEVEREQKKYEELLGTAKEYGSSEPSGGSTAPSSFTALEYSPGNYTVSHGADYNPTPLAAAVTNQSSKYTLDSFDTVKSKGSSLEYVPTVVTQPKKYSSSVAKSKYIIDNSKPSTDLEYDPLLNYSARLLSKAASKQQKGAKRKRAADHREAYSPSRKKHCEAASNDEPLARFSDSEEECPTPSVTHSKPQDSSESKLSDEVVVKEKRSQQKDSSSRQMKEMAVQYDMGDIKSPWKPMAQDSLEKSANTPSSRHAKEEERNSVLPKDKLRKKNLDGHNTEEKKERSKVADKERAGMKARRQNGERIKEQRGKSHADGHSKKLDKGKLAGGKEEASSKRKSEGPGKRSGTEKVGSVKKDGKLKNRKVASTAERTDRKGKPPEKSKEKSGGSQVKGGSEAKCKPKRRALSHVDLFGDESGDEGQAAQPLPAAFPDVSSDSDGDNDCFPLPQSNGVSSVKRPKLSKCRPPSSSSSDDEVDYSVLERDLDFESDPMEECLRIFNESVDVKMEDKGRLGKQPSKQEGTEEKVTEDSLTTLFPGQKRRISHLPKQGNAEAPSKPVIRPYRPPTAQEVCYQRIQLAQKQAAQLVQQQPRPAPVLSTAPPRAAFALHKGEKKRIAHVPHTALSAAPRSASGGQKKPIPSGSTASSNGTDTLSLKARTLTGMASKTTTTNAPKRIAHAPTLQSAALKRPVIPTEFGAKVPTNIRQRYLNLFIDECLKSCPSQQEAFDKALSEEKVAYERSTSRNIYLNVAVNTLKKLRSLLPGPSQGALKTNRKVVSHEAMLGGKLAAKTSFTLNRSASLRTEDLTGAALYRRLKEYVMTEDELKENGYPMPCPEKPSRAVVFTVEEKKAADSSCRVCCRCGAEYMVTPSGNCVRKEECVHHWGKLRKQRVPGGWETHYNCCSGAVGSPGCQVAKQHVHDGRKENLDGFVKTFEKLPSPDGYPGIYALDCEMCYTKQGLELTRVTVINADLKVVYDTFVQPDHKVVDYNTRFSGVTEADLENASITLRDVQAVLLNMFSMDTILIGHSLESDLFALKMIHCTVVDTAVVFPHRLGMPYKRALRTLMADYLKRIIQDSGKIRYLGLYSDRLILKYIR
ncbi:RNA exonuclease 1 homolog isoform X2 [Hemicordylus capensis]|uniref:RNA exonuclease 1 homolog isoform X2 n=1 Tax=Hemicordylus capensis TaxID=884348 RepID=UPI00230457C4|nr:RNA exonuclease 1 homolog isoform X2 [Hemicordylus capensis]